MAARRWSRAEGGAAVDSAGLRTRNRHVRDSRDAAADPSHVVDALAAVGAAAEPPPPIRSWPQAQVNEGRGADRSVGLRAVWILSTPRTRVHGRAARLRSRSCLLRGPPSTRSRRPPSTSRFRPNSPAISRSLYTDLQQHGVDARLQPGLTRDGVRRPRAATDGTEWSRPDLA